MRISLDDFPIRSVAAGNKITVYGNAGSWAVLAAGGIVVLYVAVELFWALATLQGKPRQTAATMMAPSAIRNAEGRFFIFSTPLILGCG